MVTGEGIISVMPDYAQIRSGVTTRAKTVKEAVDTNSKLMAAIFAALKDAGIAEKDIQPARFSIQPVYAPQEPRTEPKLSGYSVSNQVTVIIREIGKVGEVVALQVTDKPDDPKVKPRRVEITGMGRERTASNRTTSISELMYDRWVAKNAEQVNKLSGGKLVVQLIEAGEVIDRALGRVFARGSGSH